MMLRCSCNVMDVMWVMGLWDGMGWDGMGWDGIGLWWGFMYQRVMTYDDDDVDAVKLCCYGYSNL